MKLVDTEKLEGAISQNFIRTISRRHPMYSYKDKDPSP